MIERAIVRERKRQFQIEEYVSQRLRNAGLSHVRLTKTPLGEKIVVSTSRPGLVIGRRGETISKLTQELKEKFSLENPQIEIVEVRDVYLDARIVAERMAATLERFGTKRFKAVLYKTMQQVMRAGALGVEIVLSGKVPSQRAKSWRVFSGYLKKCGYIAQHDVRKAKAEAVLKSGVVGIKVSIMPNIKLPYHIQILDEPLTTISEVTHEDGTVERDVSEEKPTRKRSRRTTKTTKKRTTRKRTSRKKTGSSEDAPAESAGAEQASSAAETAEGDVATTAENPPEEVKEDTSSEHAKEDVTATDDVKTMDVQAEEKE